MMAAGMHVTDYFTDNGQVPNEIRSAAQMICLQAAIWVWKLKIEHRA